MFFSDSIVNNYYYESIGYYSTIFRSYCRAGDFNQIKIYIEEKKIDINSIEQGFILCCEYGHKNVAEYISKIEGINIHANDDSAFYMSCMKGTLDISKWLYKLSIDEGKPIDIYGVNEFAFRYSCIYGHINTAKWLFELSNKFGRKFDIHIENDYLFRGSCTRNNLNVAQWLYNIALENGTCIDIHAPDGDNEAFIYSCKGGYIDIVKWLCEISDDFSYIIQENGIIEYVIKDVYSSIKDLTNLNKAKKMNMQINYINININININIKQDNLNNENYCMICYDDNNILIFPCSHIMCMECFIKWYMIKRRLYVCIFCMKKIELKNIKYNTTDLE
jgi:hypothetical protein